MKCLLSTQNGHSRDIRASLGVALRPGSLAHDVGAHFSLTTTFPFARPAST